MAAGMTGLDEFALIARYFAPLAAGYPGASDLGDDVATVRITPGMEQAITVDSMVAGLHYLPEDPPDLIARKLLRVNLSDLAATGARPVAYLLAATFSAPPAPDWIAGFASGLAADQKTFGVHLIGGDTTRTTGPDVLTVTALGEIAPGAALRRGGGAVGDDVYVTGEIGDATLGLALLTGALDLKDVSALDESAREGLIARYRLPQPRCDLGPALVGLASAAADISDGLMADLGHICAQSGCGAEIDQARIPLSRAARAHCGDDGSRWIELVTGGDDYELVFTAPPNVAERITGLTRAGGPPITRIGRLVAGRGVSLRDRSGRRVPIETPGYSHF